MPTLTAAGGTCEDWTMGSSEPAGVFGGSDTTWNWFSRGCSSPFGLYCLEE